MNPKKARAHADSVQREVNAQRATLREEYEAADRALAAMAYAADASARKAEAEASAGRLPADLAARWIAGGLTWDDKASLIRRRLYTRGSWAFPGSETSAGRDVLGVLRERVGGAA